VGLRLQQGDRQVPVQKILTDFPIYLRQREEMREMIREAEESIAARGSTPLDLEPTINEVMQDLAGEGIE
jgi:hypothetical protein